MRVEAQAPGKVILFGEHAINRGQPAIAAAVGVRARCILEHEGRAVEREDRTEGSGFAFCGNGQQGRATREEILALGAAVDGMRAAEDYEGIRRVARGDYFGPQKYVLAKMFGDRLPHGMKLGWESEIPSSSGLGSGGAAFTAMVAAVVEGFGEELDGGAELLERAAWAQLGDVIAHGGVASGLDTQASLLGGVIRFTGEGLAERIGCAPGAGLIVANCGVAAATSEVNTRVRHWLGEKPESRMSYFNTIGALSRAAGPLLERGDWDELGRLMNLNQLVLEKIGVSRPEIDRLIEAALEAGAYGAKISGSGGGGIMMALTADERRPAVIQALQSTGAAVLTPELAVEGAKVVSKDGDPASPACNTEFFKHAISNY